MSSTPAARVTSVNCTAAVVAVQPARGAGVGLGRAVGLGAAVQRAPDVGGGRPAHVVAHEQVGVAVLVVVEKGRAGREVGVPDARRRGDVGEPALAVVAQHVVGAQRAQEQVGVAVVVDVGGGHAHALRLEVEAGPAGHVLEGAVAAIAVKRRGVGSPPLLGPVHPVDEDEVLVAVAFDVEKGDARAHGLREVLLSKGAVVVAERDAGLRGHVAKGGVTCRRRHERRRRRYRCPCGHDHRRACFQSPPVRAPPAGGTSGCGADEAPCS